MAGGPTVGGPGGPGGPTAGEWLARHAADDFCYLTTVGRRTGNPHEIEIWFAVDERTVDERTVDGSAVDRGAADQGAPALYMMAGGRHRSDWVRNLMKTPRVAVRIGDQTRQGQARVIDATQEPDLDARVRRLLAATYDEWEEGQQGRELSGWARTALPVEVRFEP
jgi:deazaflavin-dependent oxidoreductase (nitroreductase family)